MSLVKKFLGEIAAQDSDEPLSHLYQTCPVCINFFLLFFFSGSKRIRLPTQSTRTTTGVKVKQQTEELHVTHKCLKVQTGTEQCEVKRKACLKVTRLNSMGDQLKKARQICQAKKKIKKDNLDDSSVSVLFFSEMYSCQTTVESRFSNPHFFENLPMITQTKSCFPSSVKHCNFTPDFSNSPIFQTNFRFP